LAYLNTDEIFAVAMQQKGFVNTRYTLGLATLPYLGWATGTLLGAIATGLLPDSVSSALGVAIYGMFIAIIVPPAKKDKAVLVTVGLAIALSCALRYLTDLSSGWVIILCAVVAAGATALLFPVKEAEA
ncbi:MAG: AzlC family ABC transporter permease, partial [Clostridia bacterium]|nr:AzlC family ABC transporter permease [Clostridia bacterium]